MQPKDAGLDDISEATAKPAPPAATVLSAPKAPLAALPTKEAVPSVPLATSNQATSVVVSDLPEEGIAATQGLTIASTAKLSSKLEKQGLHKPPHVEAPTMAAPSSSALKGTSAPGKRFACQYCAKVYTNPVRPPLFLL
jgi:hypothetical protein